MQGPQTPEEGTWRTTSSHSPEAMMSVFKEIFFAGFPAPRCPLKFPENYSASKPANGTEEEDEAILRLEASGGAPREFVMSFFSQFGEVTDLEYDSMRGMGSVTFKDGEVAEHCYVAANLSIIMLPPNTKPFEDSSINASALVSILYLEYAQYLPFCNHLIMRNDLLTIGGVSRHFLRTFPAVKKSPLSRKNPLGSGNTLPKEEGAVFSKVGKLLLRCVPESDKKPTAMDLWCSFLVQYVVGVRTCESGHGLAVPSPLQRVTGAMDVGRLTFIQRYQESEALHGTMAYLLLKIRMEDDDTVGALLRDAGLDAGRAGLGVVEALIANEEDDAEKEAAAATDGNKKEKGPKKTGKKKKKKKKKKPNAPLDVLQMAQLVLNQPSAKSSFDGALSLIDRYAASGARASLMAVCSENPIAAEEPMTIKQMLWMLFDAFKGAWIVLGFVALLLLYLHFNKEDGSAKSGDL